MKSAREKNRGKLKQHCKLLGVKGNNTNSARSESDTTKLRDKVEKEKEKKSKVIFPQLIFQANRLKQDVPDVSGGGVHDGKC